ncbi:MAG TPA: hypothetical protein ENJ07_04055 [Gammaproteobacteria bacterium]|nr:hypothetical protein [Gammaproteobacteria bacterium]
MPRHLLNHPAGSLMLVFVLLYVWAQPALAAYKRIEMRDAGMVSSTSLVPSDYTCHEPNKFKALCFSKRGIYLSITEYHFGQGFVSVEQFFDHIDASLKENNIAILELYAAPEMSRTIAQRDSVMLSLRGQRVYALWMKTRLPDDILTTGVLVFSYAPNNGAPVTRITGYSLAYPARLDKQHDQIKADIGRFISSWTFEQPYVQASNSLHLQFLARLSASERAFRESQDQINRNNMSMLDSSFESYLRRSEASSAGHKRSIGAINETRIMVDQGTGQRYQVDGNFRRNFVNPNNIDQQLQTDNLLVNPNINTNIGENYNELVEEN